MRICEIEIYRDGGSIEFQVEREGIRKHVWLNTPFAGEPRALRINAIAVSNGDKEVANLLIDIDEWWQSLPQTLRDMSLETRKQKGPFRNPSAEMLKAIEVTRVLLVRDYVTSNYLQ
jgi:hypothetical protein